MRTIRVSIFIPPSLFKLSVRVNNFHAGLFLSKQNATSPLRPPLRKNELSLSCHAPPEASAMRGNLIRVNLDLKSPLCFDMTTQSLLFGNWSSCCNSSQCVPGATTLLQGSEPARFRSNQSGKKKNNKFFFYLIMNTTNRNG